MPAKATIRIFTTQTYQAEVRDAGGGLIFNRPVIWESSDTRVAVFQTPAEGQALGVGLGKTEVRATVDGVTSEPAELEVVAQGGGGGSCNFPKARWKGLVKHDIAVDSQIVGKGSFVVEGDATFESTATACVLTLIEGTLSVRGSVRLRDCTLTYAGSAAIKPGDGAIILENRPADTPPRVKYTGSGLSIVNTTVSTVCPDNSSTVTGPLGYQWLEVPLTPDYFTDPALTAFSGTYTFTNSGGSNTFTWNLTKQPVTP